MWMSLFYRYIKILIKTFIRWFVRTMVKDSLGKQAEHTKKNLVLYIIKLKFVIKLLAES